MHSVYLGLGSNIGDKEALLQTAIHQIEKQIGNVVSQSAFYVTTPWGFSSENNFLNAALCVQTELLPRQVMEVTQDIERRLGRKRKATAGGYTDRTIDIDILLYDNLVISDSSETGESLIIPHPLMTQREFVLLPLAEIAPTLVHPVLGKTMEELQKEITSASCP